MNNLEQPEWCKKFVNVSVHWKAWAENMNLFIYFYCVVQLPCRWWWWHGVMKVGWGTGPWGDHYTWPEFVPLSSDLGNASPGGTALTYTHKHKSVVFIYSDILVYTYHYQIQWTSKLTRAYLGPVTEHLSVPSVGHKLLGKLKDKKPKAVTVNRKNVDLLNIASLL